MKIKKIILNIFVCCFAVFSPIVLSGCEKEPELMSFDDLSKMVLDFDTAVRPFLSTLEYNTPSGDDKSYLSGISSSISTISYELGESFKNFNGSLEELKANLDEETIVEHTATYINIKTNNLNFISNLSEDKTNMSVKFVSGKQEYIYEVIKRNDGGYFAQIATLNQDSTYKVYQIEFLNTIGAIGVGDNEIKCVSIYNADISTNNFPNVNQKLFRN